MQSLRIYNFFVLLFSSYSIVYFILSRKNNLYNYLHHVKHNVNKEKVLNLTCLYKVK